MKKSVPLAIALTLFASAPFAQAPSAMEVATAANACGQGTITNAEFLDDGRVGVTCSPPTQRENATLVGQLAPTLGLMGVVGLMTRLAGNDNGSTSSTSSTSGTN